MDKALTPIVIPFHFLDFHNLINCWTLSLVSFFFLFLLLAWARFKPQWIPHGVQNFVELSIEFVWNMAEGQVGRHTAFFFPLFFTLFFFVFFSNLLGLVPGLMSPTSRIDVNLGMVLIVMVSVHVLDIRVNGLRGYLAHYLPPKIQADPKAHLFLRVVLRLVSVFLLLMMPFIHLIGELAKPLSLTMRLFGNMLAKEILLAVLLLLSLDFWAGPGVMKAVASFPFLLRVCIVVYGIFVCFIQAFVFMMLSMVYIGTNVKDHGEEGDGHPAAA
ncbi:MAG TPA: F0F1 ATP synthase subunit A [bacterium]|nr:F0F1 ATP synthase subunit A [bacterium]